MSSNGDRHLELQEVDFSHFRGQPLLDFVDVSLADFVVVGNFFVSLHRDVLLALDFNRGMTKMGYGKSGKSGKN